MEKEHPLMPDTEGRPWQDKEDTRTEGYQKNLKFKRPSAPELEAEARNVVAPKSKYKHEDHKLFRQFYRSLETFEARSEFGNKLPEEKERIFEEWLDKRHGKTA